MEVELLVDAGLDDEQIGGGDDALVCTDVTMSNLGDMVSVLMSDGQVVQVELPRPAYIDVNLEAWDWMASLSLSDVKQEDLVSLLSQVSLEATCPFIKREKKRVTVDSIVSATQVSAADLQLLKGTVYPHDISKEAFEAVVNRVISLRDQIGKINLGVAGLKGRMDLCLEEQKRLQGEIAKLPTKIDECTRENQVLSTRLEKVTATRERLQQRIDIMTTLMMEVNTPELSSAEKRWMDELQQLGQSLDHCKKRVVRLKSQWKEMSGDIARDNDGEPVVFGSRQLEQVTKMTAEVTEFIKGLKQLYDRVERKCAALL
jgi:archaellum component FlaC